MSESNQSPKNQPPKTRSNLAWGMNGELAFEIFCACIFLGMIGLVYFNVVLRYVFRSGFPLCEEWARLLFVYIIFFGAIEAFYRKKHLTVNLFTNMLSGVKRKTVELVAHVLTLVALLLLFFGGLQLVAQTMGTNFADTRMPFLYGTIPIMALVSFYIRGKECILALRKPASEYERKEG